MTTTLHVCKTCKAGQIAEDDADRPGALLYAALMGKTAPEGVHITEVACLSACKNGSAVALSAPGKWSYVYGEMTLDDVPAILEGAAKHAASEDGIVPWRERPEVFRKRSVARIPPLMQETAQ